MDIDPQIIIIFGAMILAGLKALFEKLSSRKNPGIQSPETQGPEVQRTEESSSPFEQGFDEYAHELRERQKIIARQTGVQAPPPLPTPTPAPAPAPVVKEVQKPQLTAAEKAALASYEKKSAAPRRKNFISTKTRLKKHLSSPTAAREALLLSEILGPPKSFQ